MTKTTNLFLFVAISAILIASPLAVNDAFAAHKPSHNSNAGGVPDLQNQVDRLDGHVTVLKEQADWFETEMLSMDLRVSELEESTTSVDSFFDVFFGVNPDGTPESTPDSFFDIFTDLGEDPSLAPDSFFDIFTDLGESTSRADSFFDVFFDRIPESPEKNQVDSFFDVFFDIEVRSQDNEKAIAELREDLDAHIEADGDLDSTNELQTIDEIRGLHERIADLEQRLADLESEPES